MKYCTVFVAAFGVLAAAALAPRPAYAWGDIGHKVVARIAWDNMRPETRAKITALLDAAPGDADLANLRPAPGMAKADADRALFESAATWPDLMRANKTDAEKTRNAKYHHGPWHYYDLFFEQDAATGVVKERTDKKNAPENALSELATQSTLLADINAPAGDRAVAIAWLEHLVGDIHMPLHNVARVTELDPDGDQGGNRFKLGKETPGAERIPNLHGYWDGIPDTAYPAQPGEDKEARIGRIARVATFSLPKPIFDREGLVQTGQFGQWNREGAEVAVSRVYPHLTRDEMPDAAYAREARDTAMVAVAKAGYRLAATLEAALAGSK